MQRRDTGTGEFKGINKVANLHYTNSEGRHHTIGAAGQGQELNILGVVPRKEIELNNGDASFDVASGYYYIKDTPRGDPCFLMDMAIELVEGVTLPIVNMNGEPIKGYTWSPTKGMCIEVSKSIYGEHVYSSEAACMSKHAVERRNQDAKTREKEAKQRVLQNDMDEEWGFGGGKPKKTNMRRKSRRKSSKRKSSRRKSSRRKSSRRKSSRRKSSKRKSKRKS
jgi:hypothetical protein